jgi:hypothetical protein
MDFEIPESLVHTLLGMIDTGSPLPRQLNEVGVCHGHAIVSSKLFDAKSLNAPREGELNPEIRYSYER